MYVLLSFLMSIGANVVSFYICKWLDRHIRDEEQ